MRQFAWELDLESAALVHKTILQIKTKKIEIEISRFQVTSKTNKLALHFFYFTL